MNAAGRGLSFIPLRKCSLCGEYIGYRFVKTGSGEIILCFDSGCGCSMNSTLRQRPVDEIVYRFNKLMDDGPDMDKEEEDFVVSIMEYL